MSTSFVKFTPLIGAQDNSQTVAYLLEIDSAKILLDCGWNFDNLESIEAIKKYFLANKRIAPSIDVVLLSHADLDHLGGYANADAKFGLDCPCFATTPVHDMGLQLIQDVIASKLRQREEQELTLEEANRAFGKITLLRYSQPYTLSGTCAGIIITAFGAGHTIGGTLSS
jgi:cleavage and polyadenylation specificity factor subunit 2